MENTSSDITPQITYYCCVLGCNSNSENSPNTAFHPLPVNVDNSTKKQSLDEKSRFLNEQLKICEQHFQQNSVLNILNKDTNSGFTMSMIMPCVNTKNSQNAQSFHDDSFILGPADIPLAGNEELTVEEEIVITPELNDTVDNNEILYPMLHNMLTNSSLDIKQEEFYDIDNICRVCMSNIDLKKIDNEYFEDVLIKDLLNSCIDLTTPGEDRLPKHICLRCVTDLKNMFDFLKRYETTKTTLVTYFQKQQDENEKRFYLEHNYIHQSVEIPDTNSKKPRNKHPTTGCLATGSQQRETSSDEIKISNNISDLVKNIQDKSNIELDGKTYVLAKAFLCKTCKELIFDVDNLGGHKCDVKKKALTPKKPANLVIKHTEISKCENCDCLMSGSAHVCKVSDELNSAANTASKKCPKCKVKYRKYHKCETNIVKTY